jgi:hypothetical protein
MDANNSISSNIQQLEPFALALQNFLQRLEKVTLWQQFPRKEAPESLARRLAEGRYLLRPGSCQFLPAACDAVAKDIFALLEKHLPERRESLLAVQDIFSTGKWDLAAFLASVLGNQGNDVLQLVRQFELEEDVVTFFAIYLARPFRRAAAHFLTEGINLQQWSCGYCPVCGHWPALSHIAASEGQRTLWCLHCGSHWSFKRTQCVYCLNEDHAQLEIVSLAADEAYRVQVCHTCRRYLKEVRSGEPVAKFAFDTISLATFAMDLLARKDGYIIESPLTVRYENPDGEELLYYSRKFQGT